MYLQSAHASTQTAICHDVKLKLKQRYRPRHYDSLLCSVYSDSRIVLVLSLIIIIIITGVPLTGA